MTFRGDGTDNPKPLPRLNPGNDYLGNLNIVVGSRIRVLKDNGRRGLVGLEGTVVISTPGSVVVELENDPADKMRVDMAGGITNRIVKARRHFLINEVERIL